jgi:glycosyltransferase involved in cell wall biosynthesis
MSSNFTQLTSTDNHNSTNSNRPDHALIFVWNNPALVKICVHLAKNLRNIEIEPVFVTKGRVENIVHEAGFKHEMLFRRNDSCITEVERWITNQVDCNPGTLIYKGFDLLTEAKSELLSLKSGRNPLIGALNEAELIIRSALCFEVFDKLIQQYKPKVCLFWNGLVLPPLALKQLCIKNNIRFACLERGLLPEMLVVDPKGINYGGSLGGENWNLIDKSLDHFDLSLALDYIEHFRSNKVSIVNRDEVIDQNDIRNRYRIPENKRIILIPLQIDYDTNIEQYSPNYKTNEAVIFDVVRAIRDLSDAIVVVKTHPESKTSDLRQIQEIIRGKGVIVSDCAIHPLIEASHLVVVRNSTVGLEALLYNKPVICLAKSAYSEKGFTYDIENSYQLKSTLNSILSDEHPDIPQKAQFHSFLYYLLNKYHYHLKDDEQATTHNQSLLKRVIGLSENNDSDLEEVNDNREKASILLNQARHYLEMNDFKNGIESLKESYRLCPSDETRQLITKLEAMAPQISHLFAASSYDQLINSAEEVAAISEREIQSDLNNSGISSRSAVAADRFGRVEFFLRQNRLGDALQNLDLALDADPLYEPAINKLRQFYKVLDTDFEQQREQRAIGMINQVSDDPVKLSKELLKLAQFNDAPRAMILTKSLLQRGSSVNLPLADISKPDVSVIIPLYNLGMYLPEALDSIRKQTHPNWECIIVNDESTDNSGETAQKLIDEYNDPRICLVHQQNKGLSGARNTGIRLAKGEFLVALDPDDSITADYFRIGCETLRKHSDLGWVYPVTLQYGAMNRFWSFRAFDPLKLLARNINPCHAMQRKALWEDVGEYNEQMLRGYEDWDYWLTALEKGWRAELIPQIMLLYRKRKSSMLKEMDDAIEHEVKCEIIRNHPAGYKVISAEIQEKMQSKRRIPKELVNQSFLQEWQQRNRKLKLRISSQVRQPSLVQL